MASQDRATRRSNVRRTNVTACARCRSRKQRCDQNIPSCSKCEQAGAECVSIDLDGRATPRSYIKSLEDRVAFLESHIANPGILDMQMSHSTSHGPFTSDSPGQQGDPLEEITMQTLETSAFSGGSINPDGYSLLRLLLSEPIRSLNSSANRADNRSLFEDIPAESNISIPGRDVATRLADAYFEHCEFFSPILSGKREFLAMVLPLSPDGTGNIGASDDSSTPARFRSYTVYATAVMLVNRTDSSFPLSRAEAYFSAAAQLLAADPHSICTGDLDHLANLLLIIQYLCFASRLAAAWNFLGLASRLVVELGLHNDSNASFRHEAPHLHQRRWLFWSFYTLERNLCVIINRPFSIPDEAIHVPLPDAGTEGGTRTIAIHLVKYRKLESEIYVTTHQKAPANGATLNMMAWREGMRHRLQEWAHGAPISSQAFSTRLAPLDIFQNVLHTTLVLLYYPSPAFPTPSSGEVLILSQSAAESIQAYKEAFRDGQLRFFWRTIHSLFRGGVAIIYCIHVARTQDLPDLSMAEMRASVNACASVLWAMAERYPPGRAYRDAFDTLANTVFDATEEPKRLGNEHAQGVQHLLHNPNALADDISLPQMALDTMFWGFENPL